MTQPVRLSIFPLGGAILFPGLQLPLHVFEPRYRALVGSALAKDRKIAMIQPQAASEGAPLFEIGCVGRIGDVEALEDGRYNIVLEGESRFRVLRELDVTTPFRQVEGELAALRQAAAERPADAQAQFDFAQAAFAAGARDEAAETLLKLVETAPEWNDGAAKAKLLQIFEAVGLEDPWVAAQRRRLSLLLFG